MALVAVAALAIGLCGVADGSPSPCCDDAQVTADPDARDAIDCAPVDQTALVFTVERVLLDDCHELLVDAVEVNSILDAAPKTSPPLLV